MNRLFFFMLMAVLCGTYFVFAPGAASDDAATPEPPYTRPYGEGTESVGVNALAVASAAQLRSKLGDVVWAIPMSDGTEKADTPDTRTTHPVPYLLISDGQLRKSAYLPNPQGTRTFEKLFAEALATLAAAPQDYQSPLFQQAEGFEDIVVIAPSETGAWFAQTNIRAANYPPFLACNDQRPAPRGADCSDDEARLRAFRKLAKIGVSALNSGQVAIVAIDNNKPTFYTKVFRRRYEVGWHLYDDTLSFGPYTVRIDFIY